jgi:hypothetical protein
MRASVLTTIGAVWFIALVSFFLYATHWSKSQGGGIGIDLPWPLGFTTAIVAGLFLFQLLGWIPTLAVGIYRLIRTAR